MKKLVSVFLAVLMLCTMSPVQAAARSASQRTEKLDLTAVTSAASNAAEGWAYDPTGDGGNPILTLTNYGTADAHSAPVLVPANTKVIVNGDCYLDNACMGETCDVLSGCCDGYLKLEGTGTLNIYAIENHGRGISVPTGGENDNSEFLYINDITVNIHSKERTNNTASAIKEGIFANHAIEFHNATINIYDGTKAIWMQGVTPIGGVNEENCNECLIDNTNISINLNSANNLWNNADGIHVVFGRIRITGSSHVTINAGTNSIYSYLSCVIESGTLEVVSTPISTAQALCYVGSLKIGAGVESVYLTTTKFPASKVLQLRNSGQSELAEGPELVIGTFADGNFATAPNPDNNNLPALKIQGGDPSAEHTVSFYGIDGELIEEVTVGHGQAATAPQAPSVVNNESGTWLFYGWDQDFSHVNTDMEVHAEYVLLGDTDLNGEVNMQDALLAMRGAMGIGTFSAKQILAGDVNSSGALDSTDALYIMRYAMDIIDSLA